ncbi:DNA ligase (ATP) CDC9-like protein [Leptotrombidium deliense]|uniref:DNA ligase (ATP) CDC9-like protein n=1 Tax=Leptotrombidium deliense TaxID=299467 RepID=A0A443RTD5_9ACAR|nr:DNA ligase (ATP) CDC9-like protein [Leptotrombidium deliense]
MYVKYAGLTISPIYKAAFGKIEAAKGVSLRFPRFVRVRNDKFPCDSSTHDQVIQMYHNQI